MDNIDIFNKAVEKAEKQGWKYGSDIVKFLTIASGVNGLIPYKCVIFSHDFAKAFWGEEYYYQDENQLFDDRLNWQYHLQQMILKKEPLEYLERFLNE